MNLSEKYNELAFYTLGLQDDSFVHQYVVDAYTAQTANKDTRPISLTFALVGLYLLVDKKYTGRQVQKFHTIMSRDKIAWPIIVLPQSRGDIDVEMVLNENPGEKRNNKIRAWCFSVWNAFNENHTTIKSVAEYYFR